MDVYDLLYLLKKPIKIKFCLRDMEYYVESINENGYCMIRFNNCYYKSVKEFFMKAMLNERMFYLWAFFVEGVEIV